MKFELKFIKQKRIPVIATLMAVTALTAMTLAACEPAKADSPAKTAVPVISAVLRSNAQLTAAKSEAKYAYVISASGCPGGDFSEDAALPNPIDPVVRVLAAITNSGIRYDLCTIEAGTDALTAPTEAAAIIAVNEYERYKALQVFGDAAKEFEGTDVSVAITQTVVPEYAVSAVDAGKVVTQLSSLSGSDFAQDNEGLADVVTGRVSLNPNRFICDISVIGSDEQAVEKISGECGDIEALSGIPLKRIS
jgi:hypothetical protein